MKCKDCEYYGGRDSECGEVICDFENTDITACPYIGEDGSYNATPVSPDITISLESVKRVVVDTVETQLEALTRKAVTDIVKAEYESRIKKATEDVVNTLLQKQIEEFMKGDITIGGGWSSPQRTLTRNEYLTEILTEALDSNIKGDKLRENIISDAKRLIDKYADGMKNDVNYKLKSLFDDATKQALTSNIVAMLMDNETFRRLQGSMQNLITTSKGN